MPLDELIETLRKQRDLHGDILITKVIIDSDFFELTVERDKQRRSVEP